MGSPRPPIGAGSCVLVTGASGGIGYAIAEEAARRGARLVLVSRNEERLTAAADRLSETHGVRVDAIAADLRKPRGIDQLLAQLTGQAIVVDVLVNNAGFGRIGSFVTTEADELTGMVDLNVLAPIRLTRALVPTMVASRRGAGVLNVASVAGLQPAPEFAVYHATKAFLISWSHAIREELRREGIHVSCLNPGPVPTGFDERAAIRSTRIRHLADVSASRVAAAGWAGLVRNRATVTPGALAKVMSVGSKLAPRQLVVGSTRMIYRNAAIKDTP